MGYAGSTLRGVFAILLDGRQSVGVVDEAAFLPEFDEAADFGGVEVWVVGAGPAAAEVRAVASGGFGRGGCGHGVWWWWIGCG